MDSSVIAEHFISYLTPPLKEFPLEFGIGAKGPECFYDGLPEGRKSFKIGLVVLIQYQL